MTTTKTSIDTTGKKLTTVLTELIAQPNAFARLPRGLVLAWRIVDGTRALFTMTRAGELPSDTEVATVRQHAPGTLKITVLPKPVKAMGRDKEGKEVEYRGYQWVLEREGAGEVEVML